jgi:hypothetical protein
MRLAALPPAVILHQAEVDLDAALSYSLQHISFLMPCIFPPLLWSRTPVYVNIDDWCLHAFLHCFSGGQWIFKFWSEAFRFRGPFMNSLGQTASVSAKKGAECLEHGQMSILIMDVMISFLLFPRVS